MGQECILSIYQRCRAYLSQTARWILSGSRSQTDNGSVLTRESYRQSIRNGRMPQLIIWTTPSLSILNRPISSAICTLLKPVRQVLTLLVTTLFFSQPSTCPQVGCSTLATRSLTRPTICLYSICRQCSRAGTHAPQCQNRSWMLSFNNNYLILSRSQWPSITRHTRAANQSWGSASQVQRVGLSNQRSRSDTMAQLCCYRAIRNASSGAMAEQMGQQIIEQIHHFLGSPMNLLAITCSTSHRSLGCRVKHFLRQSLSSEVRAALKGNSRVPARSGKWAWSSPNGFLPRTIQYRITPKDQISTLVDISGCLERSKHSGGKYEKVPLPWLVSSILVQFSSMTLLMPRSHILNRPQWYRIFQGLRSQWMILELWLCRYQTPYRIQLIIFQASFSGNTFLLSRYRPRSSPSQYSSTAHQLDSSFMAKNECSLTMWGWFNLIWVLFSLCRCLSKLRMASMLHYLFSDVILHATTCNSLRSKAQFTYQPYLEYFSEPSFAHHAQQLVPFLQQGQFCLSPKHGPTLQLMSLNPISQFLFGLLQLIQLCLQLSFFYCQCLGPLDILKTVLVLIYGVLLTIRVLTPTPEQSLLIWFLLSFLAFLLKMSHLYQPSLQLFYLLTILPYLHTPVALEYFFRYAQSILLILYISLFLLPFEILYSNDLLPNKFLCLFYILGLLTYFLVLIDLVGLQIIYLCIQYPYLCILYLQHSLQFLYGLSILITLSLIILCCLLRFLSEYLPRTVTLRIQVIDYLMGQLTCVLFNHSRVFLFLRQVVSDLIVLVTVNHTSLLTILTIGIEQSTLHEFALVYKNLLFEPEWFWLASLKSQGWVEQ